MRSLYLIVFLIFNIIQVSFGQIEVYGKEIIMHSHNDYEQEFPLTTALENQFRSIEIDVFEHKGEIVVAHDPEELHKKPTIEELYLNPLFSKGKPSYRLILLIDIKEITTSFMDALHAKFEPYQNHLINLQDADTENGVQIVLSGDVPKKELIASDAYPFFFIDGRISDFELPELSKRIVMISAKFTDLCAWTGDTKLTKNALSNVINVINQAKAKGKLTRFWDTADNRESWKILLALDVDLIGVDDIEEFGKFVSATKQIKY